MARQDGRVIAGPGTSPVAPHVRAAAGGRPAPVAVVDLAAFDANAAELLRRAAGRPVRLATKSVRVPALVERAVAAGFRGLMAYSLREALWWARRGAGDVLVGYPTADTGALAELAADPSLRAAVTLMVDDAAHLALLQRALDGSGPGTRPPRCACAWTSTRRSSWGRRGRARAGCAPTSASAAPRCASPARSPRSHAPPPGAASRCAG